MADTSNIPSMPDEIPCPYVSDYGITTVNPLQATTMTSGRVRVRNRFANVPQQVSLTYRLNDKQVRIFEGFMRWEANNGAGPFKQNLRFPKSTELEPYVVQLTAIYSGPTWVENSLGIWEITYTAITMQDERTSVSDYALLALLGYDSYQEALDALDDVNLHWDPQYWDNAVGLVGESIADSLVRMNTMNTHWVPGESV